MLPNETDALTRLGYIYVMSQCLNLELFKHNASSKTFSVF